MSSWPWWHGDITTSALGKSVGRADTTYHSSTHSSLSPIPFFVVRYSHAFFVVHCPHSSFMWFITPSMLFVVRYSHCVLCGSLFPLLSSWVTIPTTFFLIHYSHFRLHPSWFTTPIEFFMVHWAYSHSYCCSLGSVYSQYSQYVLILRSSLRVFTKPCIYS